jgi:hypothetical protein
MGVLRLREFRLLLGAQAVSMVGDRMVGIALAFAVLELAARRPTWGSCSRAGRHRWWRRCWSAAWSPIGCRGER